MLESSAGEMERVAETRSEDWVEVGRVAKPFGLEGWLLIQLYGDDPTNLLAAEQLRLQGTPGRIPFRVLGAESAGPDASGQARLRVRLGGLGSKERAEVWTGASVWIPESVLAPLPEGEFYWRELIGLRIRTLDGRDLGRVDEIWPTGSNDVLVVRQGAQTLLVPALRTVLTEIDKDAGEIRIDPPPGLLPEDE